MALLEVSNLGIAFGGLQAVAQLDLSIEKGHLYGLIGPNGAGKTTVFNMRLQAYRGQHHPRRQGHHRQEPRTDQQGRCGPYLPEYPPVQRDERAG